MTYDLMETEHQIQASAERLAAAEGFDWYGTWDSDSFTKRRIYRTRAAEAVIPNLPDDHPWKKAAR